MTEPAGGKPSAFHTIVLGGLAIGILDFLDASIFLSKLLRHHLSAGLVGPGVRYCRARGSQGRRLEYGYSRHFFAFRCSNVHRDRLFPVQPEYLVSYPASGNIGTLVRRDRELCDAVRRLAALGQGDEPNRRLKRTNWLNAEQRDRTCFACRPAGSAYRGVVRTSKFQPAFITDAC